MLKNRIKNVPRLVGLIMDGNRRWAKKRLLPAAAGHSAGVDRMVSLAEKAQAEGIEYLTVYALSTENLDRPKEELDRMFLLLRTKFSGCAERLIAQGAAIRVVGDLSLLPDDVRSVIESAVAKSPKYASFTFIMAIAYGGRNEIVRAANLAVKGGAPVTEEEFSSLIYTADVPDPDFIIRTGGEVRLSNFMLWQAAYAELYFSDSLFPDFSDGEFVKALDEYASRTRRFGKN